MTAKLFSYVLGFSVAVSAIAADQKQTTARVSAGPVTAVRAPKRYPYHANVAAIDLVKNTITLDGKKKQRVLNITPTTRVLKDKKPVALDTIKVGEYITGSLVDIDGRLEPTTVNVGGTGTKQVAQVAATPSQTNSTPQKTSG
ncbi:MAG: hypothetical protein JWO95_3148, partial [Verrucomicrobiales bacterium]|nr:hypothetical protein [Verrucomicrobiales bacterium]